jgi:hypothetical protein
MCVDNDMREKDFVGSKEWIGSMEVGWLLQWCFPVHSADLRSCSRFALHIGGGWLDVAMVFTDAFFRCRKLL